MDWAATEKRMGKFGGALKDLGDKTKTHTVRIAESFKDMAEKTMAAFSSLIGAIKGGGFLDILQAGVGLFLQLGSTGLFGKGLASNINGPAFGGFRANGGPISAGKAYMVGERGPELVVPNHGGRVISNDNLRSGGGAQRVEIVDTTGLFRFKVNGQIMEAAPAIAGAGASLAGKQAMFQRSRRLA